MIRREFNDGGFFRRTLPGGDLSTSLVWERHADANRSGEPHCTNSQMLLYKSNGSPVALVHQYLRPDGEIGVSGRPDPKVLVRENGETIRISTSD